MDHDLVPVLSPVRSGSFRPQSKHALAGALCDSLIGGLFSGFRPNLSPQGGARFLDRGAEDRKYVSHPRPKCQMQYLRIRRSHVLLPARTYRSPCHNDVLH